MTFSMVALFGERIYDLFQDNFVLAALLERLGPSRCPIRRPSTATTPPTTVSASSARNATTCLPVNGCSRPPKAHRRRLRRPSRRAPWQQLDVVAAGRDVAVDSARDFGSAGLTGFLHEIERITDAMAEAGAWRGRYGQR